MDTVNGLKPYYDSRRSSDSEETLEKLPYDGHREASHNNYADGLRQQRQQQQQQQQISVSIPSDVPRCRCQHGNATALANQRRPFVSQNLLVVLLALLYIVVLVQLVSQRLQHSSEPARRVQVLDGGDASGLDIGLDLGGKEEVTNGLGHHVMKRSQATGGTKKRGRTKRHRRHRGKKLLKSRKDEDRQFRVRRSNSALRTQIETIQQEVSNFGSQLTNSLSNIRNDIGRLQRGERAAIHLHYTRMAGRNLFYSGRNFVWSIGHNAAGLEYFRYNWSPDHDLNSNVVGIIIEYPGQYQIYSQVIVNGRIHSHTFPLDCGHETVVVRNNQPRILLKTFITQHNLGEALFGPDGNSVRPKDNSFQMGVFDLEHDDEIRIRAPSGCSHYLYAGDRHANYFGLIRI